MLHITNSVLYQVRYRARLLHEKSHAYGADYVMHVSTFISLQIMKYGKDILRSEHIIVHGTIFKKNLLIINLLLETAVNCTVGIGMFFQFWPMNLLLYDLSLQLRTTPQGGFVTSSFTSRDQIGPKA